MQATSTKEFQAEGKNVIFVDWDDTLLCSSYLSGQGFRLDTDMRNPRGVAILEEIKDLQACVVATLKLALTQGEVIIITNAETGWVELSAQKFMPDVLPLLQYIHIISARSTYEPVFGNNPLKWKFHAFKDKLLPLFADATLKKNILSFGDSHVEREAVRAVTQGMPSTLCKSIKFAERPSIEQLQRQLELVCNCFQFLVTHDKNLDLCMSLTSNAEPATGASHPPADGVGESEKMMSGTSATDKRSAANSVNRKWKENVENAHPNTAVSVMT